MPSKIKIEEYVPVGQFLFASFSRDREELVTRFSEFSPEYLNGFEQQIKFIKQLEQSIQLSDEQKKTMYALFITADMLGSDLDFLSFYFKRAALDSSLISKIKKNLRQRNIEMVLQELRKLVDYVAEHQKVLESKGMEGDYPKKLKSEITELDSKNTKHSAITENKIQLFKNNSQAYDKLCSYITTVAKAGKLFYDGIEKTDDYKVWKILGRLRTDIGDQFA